MKLVRSRMYAALKKAPQTLAQLARHLYDELSDSKNVHAHLTALRKELRGERVVLHRGLYRLIKELKIIEILR